MGSIDLSLYFYFKVHSAKEKKKFKIGSPHLFDHEIDKEQIKQSFDWKLCRLWIGIENMNLEGVIFI